MSTFLNKFIFVIAILAFGLPAFAGGSAPSAAYSLNIGGVATGSAVNLTPQAFGPSSVITPMPFKAGDINAAMSSSDGYALMSGGSPIVVASGHRLLIIDPCDISQATNTRWQFMTATSAIAGTGTALSSMTAPAYATGASGTFEYDTSSTANTDKCYPGHYELWAGPVKVGINMNTGTELNVSGTAFDLFP